MIVEFTGVPGSGKTSLVSEIMKISKDSDTYILSTKELILSDYNLNFLNRFGILSLLVCDIILFFIFLRNYLSCKKEFFNTLKYAFRRKLSVFHRLNQIRNLVKKFAINLYFRNHYNNRTIMIDEGISHIPFNIFVDSQNNVIEYDEVENIINTLNLPEILILVNADKKSILERLHSRGHTRVDFTNQRNIDNFINNCEQVYGMVKRCLKSNIPVIEVFNNSTHNVSCVAEEVMRELKKTIDFACDM